jgi:peroxiredoxin/predicted 2-oxoglutarate/Fe(II)-dependent dioxygenase YbiX
LVVAPRLTHDHVHCILKPADRKERRFAVARHRRQTKPFVDSALIEVGDRIPAFALADSRGKPVTPVSNRLSGRPLLLVFEGNRSKDAAAFGAELAALREHQDELQAHDTVVMAITRRPPDDNRALEESQALPFPILSDPEARLYSSCRLEPAAARETAVILALDPNLRVVDVVDGGVAAAWARIAAALATLEEPEAPATLGHHAPVLVLPRVLSADDCANLIEVWHRPAPVWEGHDYTNQGFDREKGDFKAANKGEGSVVQFVVRDRQVQDYLDAKLRRRVIPEIQKAFQTKVSRREDFRIAAYDAAEGGRLGPHRDNAIKTTRHRRFTVAVTLNAGGFEGGGLRFREYSEEGYLVPTGTAIVWSAALLHEVLPVTAGCRYVLATHLFGGSSS